MSDDTGNDWAALARCVDTAARFVEDHEPESPLFARDLREAAVGLRRLAQLDTAIGDPGNLRLLADTFDLPILRRIAAAAVSGSGGQR